MDAVVVGCVVELDPSAVADDVVVEATVLLLWELAESWMPLALTREGRKALDTK